MTGAHYRYLLLEQGAGGFLVNVGINLAIAWLLFRSLASVPLWGVTSIAGDTVATCFLLPFMTCVIVSRMALREIRRGRFEAPSWKRSSSPTLRRLPSNTERRALLLGAISVATFAPLTIWVLVAIGIDQLSFLRFLVFKSLFAGILGGALTPVIALAALGDASTKNG